MTKVRLFATVSLVLVACGGSGSQSSGAGGTPEATGGVYWPPGGAGGGIVLNAGGAVGGTTAVAAPHPFGDGTITNTAPVATKCGSAGNGKAIAIVAAQGNVAVSAGTLLAISPSNLSVLGTYADSQGTHKLLAMSGNGSRLVAVTSEVPKVARVWDTKTHALVATLEGHARDITAIAIDSTGATVATGSSDGSIKVWNATGGAATRTLTPSSSGVALVAIEAGNIAAAGSMDLRVFGPSSDTALVTDSSAFADALAFSSGGAALFVASSSTVDLYNVAKGTLSSSSSILDSRNVGLSVRRILPSSSSSATLVYEYTDKWVVETTDIPVPALSGTPSGYAIATSLSDFAYDGRGSVGIDSDGSLRTVSSTGTVGSAVALPRFPGNRLDISPSGDNIAQGTPEGPVRVFAASGLSLQSTLTGNTSTVNAVRYDHAGTRLFAGSQDGTIRVWSPDTKTELKSRQVGAVYSLALSPDDTKLAVGTVGSSTNSAAQVLLLDSTTLEPLATFDMTVPNAVLVPTRANAVAFSADGATLAIGGSYNNAIQLWSLDSKTRLWYVELDSYAAALTSVRFIGSKYLLANMVIGISGTANDLQLYDVATGVQVSGYKFADTTIASPRIAIAITGDLLVGGYENGSMEIWHLPTGKSWFTIANAHTQGVRDLAVQKDGSILSTSPDGVLGCWTMPKP